MDDLTLTVNAPLESEPPNESLNEEASPEQVSEAVDEVGTVADEILVEVKECRTKLDQTMADLERLQSEGGPARQSQVTELQTEVRNLREEMRNLLAELKALQSGSPQDSPQSIPLNSLPETEEVTVIDPAEDAPVVPASKKKKRYKI